MSGYRSEADVGDEIAGRLLLTQSRSRLMGEALQDSQCFPKPVARLHIHPDQPVAVAPMFTVLIASTQAQMTLIQ